MAAIGDLLKTKSRRQFLQQLVLESQVFPIAFEVIKKEIPEIKKYQFCHLKQNTLFIKTGSTSVKNRLFLQKRFFQKRINSLIGSPVIADITII